MIPLAYEFITKDEAIRRAKKGIVELESMINEFLPMTRPLVLNHINQLKSNVAVWENVQ